MKKCIDLVVGNKYWVATKKNFYYNIGEKEYKSIKCCTFKSKKENPLNYDYVYFFEHDEKGYYEINESELTYLVFETKDDYLFFLSSFVNKTKSFVFDNFFKQKIKESQQNNPEKWI